MTIQNCGRLGHIARACPGGAPTASSGFVSRAPPPGRALNTSTLPPVKCYRCGGPNHMARDCLAAPGTLMSDSTPTGPAANLMKNKTCYKCQMEGHIARDCPENAEFSSQGFYLHLSLLFVVKAEGALYCTRGARSDKIYIRRLYSTSPNRGCINLSPHVHGRSSSKHFEPWHWPD
ncbi:hypothetical protein BD779DRAFT_1465674 [Infundibulicybe gibba]|nr:hypothetical protein BD779DRAFT_1465674 [Infundibulicybe gibba]